MTLFIACLLIHLLALPWGWYVFAVALWVLHLLFWNAPHRHG